MSSQTNQLSTLNILRKRVEPQRISDEAIPFHHAMRSLQKTPFLLLVSSFVWKFLNISAKRSIGAAINPATVSNGGLLGADG
jgi:hypothetical protein